MKRKIYHVVWRNGKWHVRRPRARRSTGTFVHKDNACFFAALKGTTARFSQVVIHGKNGKILREFTQGDDPRRTVG